MDKVKTFEDFEKKIKFLEAENIRNTEKLKSNREKLNESLNALYEKTGTKDIAGAIEYMKNLKQELADSKNELDKEIEYFNEILDDIDAL